LATVLAASCTYISTAKFEEKRRSIDEDGDGSPWSEDCDDQNGDRNPGLAEVPYDGIDNDCTSGTPDDDLDADGFDHAGDCDDTDPAVTACEEKDGCGCTSAGPGGALWLWAVALLRRRRASNS
jgi:uncharacterized protein (TIGR03382 family)